MLATHQGAEIARKQLNIIENDAPYYAPKICLDQQGDCKSVLQYCPRLKGVCDKTCGFCKGMLSHQHTFVFGLEDITLKKGNLIARIPYIGKEYEITFDLLPIQFNTGWRSVIHFTVNNKNVAARGDRQPAIWFHGIAPTAEKNKMYFCADISGNKDKCFSTDPFIVKNRWVKIQVTQHHVYGGYYYNVAVNGFSIFTIKNSKPAVYKQLYVYGGDPWHSVLDGRIKNLVIKTSE